MDGWEHKAAFVIQFRPETDVKAGRFEGRIEHIPSSRAIRFQSLDQLLTFIAKLLAGVNATKKRTTRTVIRTPSDWKVTEHLPHVYDLVVGRNYYRRASEEKEGDLNHEYR
jgi:hypothetical protein